VLEGLEAIRKRPGMYVGGTGLNALHHLVYECVDNSIDEAMAGFASQVLIRLGVDGSCTVVDDGRGMPVDPMKSDNPKINGRPAVEVILTEVHAGGKFDSNAYKVSGGLHGVGVKCVNALSAWTEVEVHKDGKAYGITFERGKVVKPVHTIRDGVKGNGTRISFLPDPEIFPDTGFRAEMLESRLRELAYLNPGVSIRFVDERVGPDGSVRDVTFKDDDGIAAYVRWLNEGKRTESPVIGVRREESERGLRADIALQYTDATQENLLAFGNNIRNPDGGTHVQGFKTALTRVINAYAKREGILKDLVPTGDDLREGLTAVVSVKLPNPQFNNQTKEKLLNEEIEGFVSSALGEELTAWLDSHPKEAKHICLNAIRAAEAREAARKARELIKRKGALGDNALPQKLSDCSSDDVERTEIFIVEGESAGGSAKGGRDHVHQAILPLRGKLLNVEKCRIDKVLAFEEIQTLVQALQCGIGEDMDVSKLRYGRIIIMTDADVDGSHIRTLLLTFFFRQMYELVRQGRIYIAQPPLYQVARGKQVQYVINDKSMNDTLSSFALQRAVLVVRSEDGSPERTIEGDALRRTLRLLSRLDELVGVTQRRGITFQRLLEARAQVRATCPATTWCGAQATISHGQRPMRTQRLRAAQSRSRRSAPRRRARCGARCASCTRPLSSSASSSSLRRRASRSRTGAWCRRSRSPASAFRRATDGSCATRARPTRSSRPRTCLRSCARCTRRGAAASRSSASRASARWMPSSSGRPRWIPRGGRCCA
jgi:DNA gyrase subunit B